MHEKVKGPGAQRLFATAHQQPDDVSSVAHSDGTKVTMNANLSRENFSRQAAKVPPTGLALK